jgi:hypothetical protein
MGQMTKAQYVNYLEGLKSTLIPGTRQFKDLELQIKQLKDNIQGGLQFNLPTSLKLPTLYEARRVVQTGGASMAEGRNVGYQDNRRYGDINIYVPQGMNPEDVANAIAGSDRSGRNGTGARRY